MQTIKFPIAISLYKSGEMIYFSQLDLIHILERALRRTNLALYFTQGFNPHVKISFKNGLKLGLEGMVEVIFYFTENIVFSRLRETLQPQLPKGLEIINKEISG